MTAAEMAAEAIERSAQDNSQAQLRPESEEEFEAMCEAVQKLGGTQRYKRAQEAEYWGHVPFDGVLVEVAPWEVRISIQDSRRITVVKVSDQ